MKFYIGASAISLLLVLVFASTGDLSGRLGVDLGPLFGQEPEPQLPPTLWLDIDPRDPCPHKGDQRH